jgi:hypothetical protein
MSIALFRDRIGIYRNKETRSAAFIVSNVFELHSVLSRSLRAFKAFNSFSSNLEIFLAFEVSGPVQVTILLAMVSLLLILNPTKD